MNAFTAPGLVAAAMLLLSGCSAREPSPAPAGPRLTAQLERQTQPSDSPGRLSAFSRDGALLALTNADGTVLVTRTSDGQVVRRLMHEGGATAPVFSANADRLFTAGYDGIVRIWHLASERQVGRLAGAEGTLWTIALSPDGTRLAAAGEDRIIRIWQLGSQAPPLKLRGHERNVWDIAFSPDGRRIASGSFDNSARIWDSATGRQLHLLAGHTQGIVGLDYSPDGRMIATGGDDYSIRLWSAADGRLLRTIPVPTHVHKVEFSPDNRWLASGGRSRGGMAGFWSQSIGSGGSGWPVRLWRVSDGALVQSLPHGQDTSHVAISPDGRRLVTAGEDGAARIWTLRTQP